MDKVNKMKAAHLAAIVKRKDFHESTEKENHIKFEQSYGDNGYFVSDYQANAETINTLLQSSSMKKEAVASGLFDSLDEDSKSKFDLADSFLKSITTEETKALFDEEGTPSIGRLGFSYTSGTTYTDPTFFFNKPVPNRNVIALAPYIRGGMPFTTDTIKTNFISLSGQSGIFNWQWGIKDAAINQSISQGYFGTHRFGMSYMGENPWAGMLREAHGIPLITAAYVDYYLEMGLDDRLAYGDPENNMYGLFNSPHNVLDFSNTTALQGIGDGYHEGTQLLNVLLTAITLTELPTNDGVLTEIIEMLVPLHIYTYVKNIRMSLQAKIGSADWVGGTESYGNFWDYFTRTTGIKVRATSVEQPNILLLSRKETQNYNPITFYVSETMGTTRNTMSPAPSNFIIDRAKAVSECIILDPANVTEIILPQNKANLSLVKLSYTLAPSTIVPQKVVLGDIYG